MKAATLINKIVSLATGEVGTMEKPAGSNRGPRVDEYQKADWLDGVGYAWCASFICWLVLQAINSGIKVPFERPRTAGAWDFENWAKKQKGKGVVVLRGGEIRRGDIVIFTFSHIGLAVADEEDRMIRTVEGNTDKEGGREGLGVFRKLRNKSKIKCWIRFLDTP